MMMKKIRRSRVIDHFDNVFDVVGVGVAYLSSLLAELKQERNNQTHPCNGKIVSAKDFHQMREVTLEYCQESWPDDHTNEVLVNDMSQFIENSSTVIEL